MESLQLREISRGKEALHRQTLGSRSFKPGSRHGKAYPAPIQVNKETHLCHFFRILALNDFGLLLTDGQLFHELLLVFQIALQKVLGA